MKPAAQPLRVLIVPDKFKGTLAAAAAAAALARGWRSVRAWDELDLLPMSDGGDGFGEVMGRLLRARVRTVRTLDAAHRPVTAPWWWVPGQKLAVIEAARVVGLAGLPPQKFHPFQLDTFGLGRVLRAAVRAGARHCVLGLGGSATNDGGFGLARALGWKFWDDRGAELDQWWQLCRLARVTPPAGAPDLQVTAAVDVANPLLGARGASRVYGPQKGLRPDDWPFAESCLRRLAAVLARQLNIVCARTPGAGAAGGLGFGLMAFAGARTEPGFEIFARAARLEERIREADWVLTGEGAVDEQTFMGKGVGRVARLCARWRVPCAVLAGVVNVPPKHGKIFARMAALTEIATLAEAKARPRYYLEQLGAQAAVESAR